MKNLKQHLHDRGMNPDLYRVMYDDEEGVCTFLLHNWVGHLVGFQQYRPGVDNKKKKNDPKDGRYYSYLPSAKNVKNSADPRGVEVDGFWGLEAYDPNKVVLFVVEGVFKAAVLHRLGFNAIAVLSGTPKRLRNLFALMKTRHHVVALGDNDAAGKKLVDLVGVGFKTPVDVDEMNEEDLLKLLEENVDMLYKVRGNVYYGK